MLILSCIELLLMESRFHLKSKKCPLWGKAFNLSVTSRMKNTIYTKMKLNPLSANPTKWSNTLKQLQYSPSSVSLETFNQKLKAVIKQTFSWTRILAIALLEDPWRYCFLKSPNIAKPFYPQICAIIFVILFAQKNEEKLSSTFRQKFQQASSNNDDCVVIKISLFLM